MSFTSRDTQRIYEKYNKVTYTRFEQRRKTTTWLDGQTMTGEDEQRFSKGGVNERRYDKREIEGEIGWIATRENL